MPEFEAGTFTIGTLLGMIFGAFLGHALAIRRGKFQVKNKAEIDFRKSIMPAIFEIERGKNAQEIITSTFVNHYEAAIEYTAYLKGKNLVRFKSALMSYKSWHKTVCNRNDAQVMYEQDAPKYVEMLEIGPIKYLHELLKYAKT